MQKINHSDFSNLDFPIVLNNSDARTYQGKVVYVIGIYKQMDVRMKQINPKVLYKGHASITLQDDYVALLYPPARRKAIRSKEEIEKFENQYVKVKGVIYPFVPQEGNTMMTPCLTEVHSIELLKN